MLTKLVEKQTPESMEVHLAEIMPGLLKVRISLILVLMIIIVYPRRMIMLRAV